MPVLDFLSGLIKPVTDLIDGFITTDEEKQKVMNELVSIENQLNVKMLEYEAQIAQYQSQVIIAEAKGESWLQRNWRPSLMAVFGVIVANNYILAPYLQEMFDWTVVLEIPEQLWGLLKLGVGGYIGGRSIEKGIKLWKGKDAE
jgi:hypothetical protein